MIVGVVIVMPVVYATAPSRLVGQRPAPHWFRTRLAVVGRGG